jgi:dolichol-phosphate mannosyltransferase
VRADLAIIIPCCNEEEALGRLQEQLRPVLDDVAPRYHIELVLVDDGSTDATWDWLQLVRRFDWPARVILGQHERNRGLGAALRTGLDLTDAPVIVTIDVDGTYPFRIIEPLLEAIANGADVATASPYHPDGGVAGVSAWRMLFSRGASMLYRVLVDRRIHTYTALVRAYRRDILDETLADHPGFLNVAVTLVEACRRKAIVAEIPAVLAQREVGQSKARIMRITRSHLRYMAQLIWLRMTGRFWLAERRSQALQEKRSLV